jgi:plastocyanin
MARRTLFVLAAMVLASLALPTAAIAGGGCHDGATSGTGDTVEMKDACFRPSTLQIDPGTTVTFVNRDAMTHNVTAMGWGQFEDMNQGDAFRATFEESGVYPYACQYHPGMTGAILVGDGTGAGNGETVTSGGVAPYNSGGAAPHNQAPADPDAQALASEPVANDTSTSAVGWVAGATIGLTVGLAGGLLVRRRGRASA